MGPENHTAMPRAMWLKRAECCSGARRAAGFSTARFGRRRYSRWRVTRRSLSHLLLFAL